jgi:hypothetical protein
MYCNKQPGKTFYSCYNNLYKKRGGDVSKTINFVEDIPELQYSYKTSTAS